MDTMIELSSNVKGMHCSECKKEYGFEKVQTYATCCQKPLLVDYVADESFPKEALLGRETSMWRYFEMLPVKDRSHIVTLGEGMTPLLPLTRVSEKYGFSNLLVKDESGNPTGSFKARGISAAVSKAVELGIAACIVPTAGNAGGALAAYCAKAGIECTVVMPRHTPEVFKNECELYGAKLHLVDGLINDCAKKVEELKAKKTFFDVSTLKEPYRLEGKKTMGYEIAEQLNWKLPDFILYPAGGGTGLIGIWKAFKEMLALGWITGKLPRMMAVQSLNCCPLIRSFGNAGDWKTDFQPQPTIANGLAVPYPFGLTLMQQVLKESKGSVIGVSDEEIKDGLRELAREEGMLVAPEGAAVWKALLHLREQKLVDSEAEIVLLNTGSGYKYLENLV
jgi:threonine synthase